MFHQFSDLYALGHALGQVAEAERLADSFRGLKESLGLSRLFQVNPEGRPLMAMEEAGIPDADVGSLFLDLGTMQETLKLCVQNGQARVFSVDVGPFLCRQTSSSMPLPNLPRDKSLLCVPHTRADGTRTALLLTSLRPPAVAFRYEDLAVVAAVQEMLSE